MTIQVKKFNLPDSEQIIAESYKVYEQSFKPLRKVAVQNHMMSYSEFVDMWQNPWLEKYLGYVDGDLAGMSVMTNKLDEWPLISPEYFETKYPEEYYSSRVWYFGFSCIVNEHQKSGLFKAMLSLMAAGRQLDLFFMDFCKSNIDKKILMLVLRTLQSLDEGVMLTQEDVQEFWKVEWC